MRNSTLSETLCLQAFAGVAAASTHDLKNCLAVINETSGLLEDYGLMLADEGSMPLERVQKGTRAINRQIRNADTILKNLNRFAHSFDTPVATVNIHVLLSLMITLCARKAAPRMIQTSVAGHTSLQCQTRTALLETLMYRLLCTIYKQAMRKSELIVQATLSHELIIIQLKYVPDSTIATPVAGEEEHLLSTELAGNIDEHADGILLTLPLQIPDTK